MDLDSKGRENKTATEMRCYRRLFNISHDDNLPMRSFAEISKQLLENMMNSSAWSKKKKLRWFDHVLRSPGLAKRILQSTVKGKRRGRQKTSWEDNIREWIGIDFASLTRAAGIRTRGKGIVGKSSMVPR